MKETLGTVRDAFAVLRAKGNAARVEVKGEPLAMLLTYRGVREAAGDWTRFSSDAPFRVPIPSEEAVRTVRQLPIETDPPEHTAWRALVHPFFRRPTTPDYVKRIDALVAGLLEECMGRDSVEVVRELALPLQSRALTLLLGLPESEAEMWIDWGTHVFRDGDDPAAKGGHLDAYLRAAIRDADGDASRQDFFAALSRMEVGGQRLTEDQKLGFANLTFAGGRDTVIQSVAFSVALFAERREEMARAAQTPRGVSLAVEEIVRSLSPLTHIGRVCPHATEVGGLEVAAGQRVSLCWAAANFDPEVFEAPDTVRLDRMPNAHVAFGSGPHACLGAPQARAILRSLLRSLAAQVRHIEVREALPNTELLGSVERHVGFKSLVARFAK